MAERIAYYGVAANLVTYLTTDLREGLATAITSVNNWNGAVYLFPFVGAFLSDAYLGRYWTIVAFSTVYVLVSEREISSPPSVCQRLGSNASFLALLDVFFFFFFL